MDDRILKKNKTHADEDEVCGGIEFTTIFTIAVCHHHDYHYDDHYCNHYYFSITITIIITSIITITIAITITIIITFIVTSIITLTSIITITITITINNITIDITTIIIITNLQQLHLDGIPPVDLEEKRERDEVQHLNRSLRVLNL